MMRWRANYTVQGTGVEALQKHAETNAKVLAGPGVSINIEYGAIEAVEVITDGDGFQRVALWEVPVRATFDREDTTDV